MTVTERFIQYVQVHTASADDVEKTPTTECQFALTKKLKQEMLGLGFENVFSDEYAYVYGELSATPGLEKHPAILFNAHMDTVPDFPGENVKPIVTENYDGKDFPLGTSGRTLEKAVFKHLPSLKGHTLITTDGTTILGADDKAGIAEIMTAFETLIKENIPHGRVIACFSPDEEVGHGAALMDLQRVNADFGYTVDGGEPCEINYETFNAAEARWEITGFNIHPGSAKDKMINANQVAFEINAMLPKAEVPERTESYEGFFHLISMSGSVEKANLCYIVRDHDSALFEGKKKTLRLIEKNINEKYGAGTAKLTIREQYRNMAELIEKRFEIVERAKDAIRKEGMEPVTVPIRGGTDGSQLSFRGLLCPNLGTGGYACHGPYEHITSQKMEQMVKVILNIITHE